MIKGIISFNHLFNCYKRVWQWCKIAKATFPWAHIPSQKPTFLIIPSYTCFLQKFCRICLVSSTVERSWNPHNTTVTSKGGGKNKSQTPFPNVSQESIPRCNAKFNRGIFNIHSSRARMKRKFHLFHCFPSSIMLFTNIRKLVTMTIKTNYC